MTLFEFAASSLKCRQQPTQLLRLLQLTELRRVWRTYVYGDVISDIVNKLETREIVFRRFFERRDLALADTHSEHAIRSIPLNSFHKSRRAFVVESRSINQRLIFRQAKQSRSRVSWLRMKCDSACFDKPEAERREWSQRDSVFIETCGESDRIRKQQSKPADWILYRTAFRE